EVDPATMGIETAPGAADSPADPLRYLGLHGNAILSRYPLQNVRCVPFPVQGYDWYADEKRASLAQKVESAVSKLAFREPLMRQVRRGGRMMLLADVVDSSIPCDRATIVATHLEDLAPPETRRRQLDSMLAAIRSAAHPVIFAGDMNTSTHNGLPMSAM